MNTLLAEAVAALVGVGFSFIIGFHLGGLSAKETAEEGRAAQLTQVVRTYEQREADHLAKEQSYERELIGLQVQRVATPDLAVWLCPSAPRVALPAAAGSGQELPPATGVLSTVHLEDSPRRDVGHPLFALSDYADEIVAKCRAE